MAGETMTIHPLALTVAQFNQLSPYLRVRIGQPTDTGWLAASECFHSDTPYLDQAITAARHHLRTDAATVVASVVLRQYLWLVAGAVLAGYVLDRRLPDVRIDNCWIRWEGGYSIAELALAEPGFTALRSDPAADHADATTVADEQTLRAHLHHLIEDHFSFVIDRLCEACRCKAQGLWLAAVDYCAHLLLWLWQLRYPTATADELRVATQELLVAPGSLLPGQRISFIEVPSPSGPRLFLNRATCCYWYRMEGGDYCMNCPKRALAERIARLRAYVAATPSVTAEVAE